MCPASIYLTVADAHQDNPDELDEEEPEAQPRAAAAGA